MANNLKALVVSDTHHNKSSLRQIVREYSHVEHLFHLGDNVEDAQYLERKMPHTRVLYVRGNCDMGSSAPEYEEIVLAGNRIILTHGHLLHVKHSYDRALYYAQEREARALLFGHTHIAYTEYGDGIWLVNPGSAGEDSRGDMSVAMLIIGEMGVVPKILKL